MVHMMVTFSVMHDWFCPVYEPSTQPTFKLSERNPKKTEVIDNVTDLDAAPLSVENQRCSPISLCFHGCSWKRHWELLWGRASTLRTSSWCHA